MRRNRFRILLCLAGVLLAFSALAENELYAEDPLGTGKTISRRDMGWTEKGGLPLFSAPFPDAFQTEELPWTSEGYRRISLLGTLQDGAWGLVEISVDDTLTRVGWIPLPAAGSEQRTEGDLWMDRKPFRLIRDAEMTEIPETGVRPLRQLAAGETVIGMFFHDGDSTWLYAETRINGAAAWGFVPADALEAEPLAVTKDGETLRIPEGVTVIGEPEDEKVFPREDAENDSGDEEDEDGEDRIIYVLRILPGDIRLNYVDLNDEQWREIRTISLPSSLRRLGSEAIVGGSLETLRLGEVQEIGPDAMYQIAIETLILGAGYRGAVPDGDCRVGRWQVEEGNPLYCDVDGVLFSADRRTLLSYPEGREDEHYDVPAGTETIGAYAFSSGSMDVPLVSVSLPIGLKRIEEGAFSGCGILRSLVVPLTVTELDPRAFANCVSLERLSLPPGFTVEIGEGVEETDFTWFNGDNGSTLASPREDPPTWKENPYLDYLTTLLDNEEGRGTVPLYPDSRSDTIVEERPVLTEVTVYDVRDGRGRITDYKQSPRWVDLRQTRNLTKELFFEIADARITDPAKTGLDPAGLQFVFVWENFVVFENAAEDYVRVPLSEVQLFRDRSDDRTEMGMISWQEQKAPVPLLDRPEGDPVGHLFFGDQALVLEKQNGWMRVETGIGEGWIPGNSLIPVPPLQE